MFDICHRARDIIYIIYTERTENNIHIVEGDNKIFGCHKRLI
jgi:hypothetical protein